MYIIKKLLKIINKNKSFLAFFSIFLSLLLVVGSTYSWITSNDEKINQSKANDKVLSAVIDEDFTPNLKWEPGKTTKKKLLVKNDGQIPALIRISLYEYFAQFELDMIDGKGNASPKIVANSSGSDIKMEAVSSWVKGRTYKLSSGKYYTVSEVHKGDTQNSKTAYIYNGDRTIDVFKYLALQFNDEEIYDEKNKPAKGIQNYWYYSEGYFYYSEVVQPKEKTKQLMQSITLDKKLPNKYKASLYQLIPVMDAHDITKSLMEDWKIASGSYVETMYREKVR